MDDIVFELRRKSKSATYTYGELYYDGREIAKTIELNWIGDTKKSAIFIGSTEKRAIKAQVYTIIWLQGIFDRIIYLEQVDDKGNSFKTIRGSVRIGEKYRNGHIGHSKKALRKVHNYYKEWLKNHPTCKNGKINIIDDFEV